MIETEEGLIQEYADTDLAEGRAFLISEKDPVSSVPKTSEKATIKSGRSVFIVILLIAAISSLAWFYYSRNSIDRQTTAALDEAYTGSRPLESRITGLKYAPFAITRGSEIKEVQSEAFRKTEKDLLDAVINDKSARNRHALGRFYLARQKFENAVEQLEGAKKLAPDDARILSDLGTAYLEKSRTIPDEQGGQQLKMRAMALEEFEKAVEADPKMPEAVFNRSICRQLLVLPFQTRQSWQDYLDLDPSSKWAEEARRRLEQIETVKSPGKNPDELLQDFMAAYRARDDENAYRIVSRNREMITGKLIPQRLAKLIAESDGDQKTEYLSALEYIGNLENERSGDPFWAELAKFYSSASKEKLAALREAQKLVFQGYELSLSGDPGEALKTFSDARAIFESNGDKWNAGICGYWIGYTLNRQNRVPESTIVLENLVEPNKPYKWLSAQYLSWLGINLGVDRQFSGKTEFNEKAIDLSEAASDLYLTQKILQQQVDVYNTLGQYDRALEFTYRGTQLRRLPESSQRQTWRDLDSYASLFFAMKFYKISGSYQKEAVDLANAVGNNEKTFVIQSYIKLGQIYGAQNRYKEAFDFFDLGLMETEKLADAQLRTKYAANIRLHRAHSYRESGDCAKALPEYDESLTFYDAGKLPAYTYDAHKGRLRCYLKNNDDNASQAELSLILNLLREYRTNILEEQYRNNFFENEQNVYDIAVEYEFKRQNPETAFDRSEESKARSLLDMQESPVEIIPDISRPRIKFPAAVTEPSKLSAMQADIPENVQIVEYSVLDNKTLIWLITRDSFDVFESDVSARELREKVTDYARMIADHNPSNADTISKVSGELYRILLDPLKDKLDAGKEICIVPDKVLFRLPFATLVSPRSGKYFLTEYTFVSAPSLNVFLNSTRKAAVLGRNQDEAILSIGNPAFNDKDFPNLKSIESAGIEAEKITQIYDRHVLFTNKDAAKEKVTANMLNANVIHFAGHYIVNEGSPLLSGFVLSENPSTHKREDSILTNYEILGDKLGNTRLIILAACETGIERYYSGEGMIGSSRTFLAAGVPLVVASQWAVDSESTAELMVRFHRYRKTGNFSTAQALRRAQLDMLEGDNESYRDPYYWAGFVTFGGHAQF